MTVPSYPPVDREHGREHVVKEEAVQQEAAAERLARRLDRPIGALGLVFLLVIIGQSLAESPTLRTALTIVAWLMWTVFVAELGLRAWVAPDRRRFWRRNWWQVLFLAVPFLRFARALSLVRAVRITGVLTAAVRGSRSASRLLSDRVAWLAVTTGVVVLASSQLLFLADSYTDYAEALHAATLATIVGTPLSADGGFARVLEVVLSLYSVAVFATLAGALGAFFIGEQQKEVVATAEHPSKQST